MGEKPVGKWILIRNGTILPSVHESLQNRMGFKSLQNIGLFLSFIFLWIALVEGMSVHPPSLLPCPLCPQIRQPRYGRKDRVWFEGIGIWVLGLLLSRQVFEQVNLGPLVLRLWTRPNTRLGIEEDVRITLGKLKLRAKFLGSCQSLKPKHLFQRLFH